MSEMDNYGVLPVPMGFYSEKNKKESTEQMMLQHLKEA
jgi:hypothetical protein